jgi:hypothetical protein
LSQNLLETLTDLRLCFFALYRLLYFRAHPLSLQTFYPEKLETRTLTCFSLLNLINFRLVLCVEDAFRAYKDGSGRNMTYLRTTLEVNSWLWKHRESFLPLLEELQERVENYWNIMGDILLYCIHVDEYNDLRESLILDCQCMSMQCFVSKFEEYCSGVHSVSNGNALFFFLVILKSY